MEFTPQTKIPINGKEEELQAIESMLKAGDKCSIELEDYKKKYNKQLEINESLKKDYDIEVSELTTQNKKQREDLAEVATTVGVVHEIGPLLARAKTLVKESDELRELKVKYNRLKEEADQAVIIRKNWIEYLIELITNLKKENGKTTHIN